MGMRRNTDNNPHRGIIKFIEEDMRLWWNSDDDKTLQMYVCTRHTTKRLCMYETAVALMRPPWKSNKLTFVELQ